MLIAGFVAILEKTNRALLATAQNGCLSLQQCGRLYLISDTWSVRHGVTWRAWLFYKLLFKERVLCGRAVKSAAPHARGGQKFSIVIPPGRVCVSVSGCCNFDNFSGLLRLGSRKMTRRESTIRTQNISPGALTGSNFSVFIELVMTGGGHGGQGRKLPECDTVPQIFWCIFTFLSHPAKSKVWWEI